MSFILFLGGGAARRTQRYTTTETGLTIYIPLSVQQQALMKSRREHGQPNLRGPRPIAHHATAPDDWHVTQRESSRPLLFLPLGGGEGSNRILLRYELDSTVSRSNRLSAFVALLHVLAASCRVVSQMASHQEPCRDPGSWQTLEPPQNNAKGDSATPPSFSNVH